MTTIATPAEALDGGIRASAAALRAGLPIRLIVAESLRRADASEPLRAFTELFVEHALSEAERLQHDLDAGRDLGPLHGLPVSMKDNIDIAGSITTAGSSFLRLDPEQDATVVARLRAAGAIVVGKNNMHEFAWGGTTANVHTGIARNPWDRERSPGGSSGGSGIAVALRSVVASIGTDTGGSIRLPSALNGVTGIRPTIGRVSNAGIFPLSWSLDCAGPIASSSEDAALVLGAIAGPDTRDPVTAPEPVRDLLAGLDRPLRGLRVRWLENYSLVDVQPAIARSFTGALDVLREAGADVASITLPMVEELIDVLMVINAAEASAVHSPWIAVHRQDYSPAVLELLEAGGVFSAVDYLHAQRLRARFRDNVDRVFRVDRIDAMLSPTLPYTLPLIGQDRFELPSGSQDLHRSNMRFTSLASVPGLPALSIPIAPDDDGFPIGLQVITAAFREDVALRIGHGFQSITDHHRRRPPLG